MNLNLTRFLLSSSLLACIGAQAQERVVDRTTLKIIPDSKVIKTLSAISSATRAHSVSGQVPAGAAPILPVWKYSIISPRDGNTYTGSILGGNPFNRGARTTTVPVVLIPLRVEFTGFVRNFDPTSPDAGCLGNGNTAMSLTQQSPMFQPYNAVVNGVNMGNVTFPDAFQRASFWQSIGTSAPAYHLAFGVTVAPKQTISLANGGPYGSTLSSGGCSTNPITADNPDRWGTIDINWLNSQLNTIIANLGINAGQFPFFVLYGVVITDAGSCCILGYHNGSGNNAAPSQTYGIAGYDQGYLFGGGIKDVSILSHEILEWVNDPHVANLVPEWGNTGQVGGCTALGTGQNNLETGDPLTGATMAPVTMPNGVTYTIQEQAFFSWFIGGPYPGAGGKYSSNGSFAGFAKPCPPGGSN